MTIDTTFTNIGTQLESLLSGLVYPNEDLEETDECPVFEGVLLGFPESDFRGFRFPLAVTYVKGANYANETLNKRNTPNYIQSVIGVIVTGNTQSRYAKITELMDLIQDKFENDNNWIKLNNTVRRTEIESSALTIIPTGNELSSIAVFSLKHHVYK